MTERLEQVIIIHDLRSLGDYKPGEIGKPFKTEPHHWYIACPSCGGRGSLSNHEITENPDGTITISPSLLCYGSTMNKCSAHYFVRNNQIQWV